MSEGTNAVLAVNGCARERLRPFRPASPIDRCAAAWPARDGQSRPDHVEDHAHEPHRVHITEYRSARSRQRRANANAAAALRSYQRVQTLATYRPDHLFAEAVRHWTARRRFQNTQPEAADRGVVGFMPRSTYRAGCRRRNSTSACSDWPSTALLRTEPKSPRR